MTITFAPTDQIDELEPWVQVVLDALGHPEALVTNESYISDFKLFMASEEELATWHAGLQVKLGLEFPMRGTSIVELARRVRDARSH